MPPSPIEWLPSDHLVLFLLDLPNELDFSAIMAAALAKDPRGEKQILRLCQNAGMLSLGLVALDGTKVKANASKHKAMSHERML
jgi:hypothetical protein